MTVLSVKHGKRIKNEKGTTNMRKVIAWRLLSVTLTTLLGRAWFGDWHVTLYGLFLAVVMTGVHYWFERLWNG
jgi:hypothetical protein